MKTALWVVGAIVVVLVVWAVLSAPMHGTTKYDPIPTRSETNP